MKSIRTGEMAKMLGVTPQTIRIYVEGNKIPFHRTPSNQLFFTKSDVEEILGQRNILPEKWVYYVRSSSGAKSSLNGQIEELSEAFPEPEKVFKDRASGLNEDRKGLTQLLEKAKKGDFTHVAIRTPDRLSRFGRKFIEDLLTRDGVKVVYLFPNQDSSPHEELMTDFMSLVSSFSGRFYKMRSNENKKKLLREAADELEN